MVEDLHRDLAVEDLHGAGHLFVFAEEFVVHPRVVFAEEVEEEGEEEGEDHPDGEGRHRVVVEILLHNHLRFTVIPEYS